MTLLLDNYDSFSFLLKDYLERIGETVVVYENNDDFAEIIQQPFTRVLLSPGPRTPKQSGCLMDMVAYCATYKIPTLGVCLGHQAIGEYFGAELVHALRPSHGKTSTITHTQHPLFHGLPTTYTVCRYHSLVLQHPEGTPLQVIAQTTSHEIMAVSHASLPMWGVQFHPEAVLTEFGLQLLGNWLHYCK